MFFKQKFRYFLANNHRIAVASSRLLGYLTKQNRQHNVVMFHYGRCGSSVVGMLLNQHPQVYWGGELFAQLKSKYGSDSWVWESEKALDMVELRTRIHRVPVWGFEMKKKHFEDIGIDISSFVSRMKSMQYKHFIILKRENYLNQIISDLVGKKMGFWNTNKEVVPPVVTVPVFKGNKILTKRFGERDVFYETIENELHNEEILNITYEKDIRENPKRAFEKIVNFMGIDMLDVEVKMKKINNRTIENKLSNYDEICEHLKGTDYEWMVG